VFNAAVDFSGKYKVNMRNYETLGCAAHLISDEGIYPDGFANNEHLTMYRSFEDFIEKAEYFVKHPSVSRHIALQGNSMIKKKYSKEAQWQRFQEIVASI
jgi:spore maturation protein CgeB